MHYKESSLIKISNKMENNANVKFSFNYKDIDTNIHYSDTCYCILNPNSDDAIAQLGRGMIETAIRNSNRNINFKLLPGWIGTQI